MSDVGVCLSKEWPINLFNNDTGDCNDDIVCRLVHRVFTKLKFVTSFDFKVQKNSS